MPAMEGMDLSVVVHQLHDVKNLCDELSLLTVIADRVLCLSPKADVLLEEEVFDVNHSSLSNHYNEMLDRKLIHSFMIYLFNRRFAWKEKPKSSVAKKERTQLEIISLLDQLIGWWVNWQLCVNYSRTAVMYMNVFLCRLKSQDVTVILVEGYIYAVENCKFLPYIKENDNHLFNRINVKMML